MGVKCAPPSPRGHFLNLAPTRHPHLEKKSKSDKIEHWGGHLVLDFALQGYPGGCKVPENGMAWEWLWVHRWGMCRLPWLAREVSLIYTVFTKVSKTVKIGVPPVFDPVWGTLHP